MMKQSLNSKETQSSYQNEILPIPSSHTIKRTHLKETSYTRRSDSDSSLLNHSTSPHCKTNPSTRWEAGLARWKFMTRIPEPIKQSTPDDQTWKFKQKRVPSKCWSKFPIETICIITITITITIRSSSDKNKKGCKPFGATQLTNPVTPALQTERERERESDEGEGGGKFLSRETNTDPETICSRMNHQRLQNLILIIHEPWSSSSSCTKFIYN